MHITNQISLVTRTLDWSQIYTVEWGKPLPGQSEDTQADLSHQIYFNNIYGKVETRSMKETKVGVKLIKGPPIYHTKTTQVEMFMAYCSLFLVWMHVSQQNS